MLNLRIIPKQLSFYADDFIEGQVELYSPFQIILNDINIVLNISECWFTFSKELKKRISEMKNKPILVQNLNVNAKLNINSNLIALKPGKFTFDFKFKSPYILEPSFEFPGKEDNAYIRYILSSNIISPYTKATHSVYITLKKRQIIQMNKQITLATENNINKWGLFDGGRTKLKVTSINGTDNFKFGEEIKFDIDIDNTNGKLNTTECKIVFKRSVKFKNNLGQIKKEILDELSSRKIKTESAPGEHKNFSYVLSLNNIENKNFVIKGSGIPYANILDINYFLPTLKTPSLECSYTIVFSLYFSKFIKLDEGPKIIFNAIMCHQSLNEAKAEMAQKLNYNKKNTIPNMKNNMLPPPNIVPPHQNHMINNNMNNMPVDELPSLEEVENANKMNNNNINVNFNNNNNFESFTPVNNNI